MLAAITEAAAKLDYGLEDAVEASEVIKYSTTVGTNALIERTGPRVGLIATAGQEDTIHVARSRSWADGMPLEVQIDRTRAQRPPDLVPRSLRVGVRERVDCFGKVLMPLQQDDVLAAVDHLVRQGVRAIAVCLTWSFMNPDHEQQIRDIIRGSTRIRPSAAARSCCPQKSRPSSTSIGAASPRSSARSSRPRPKSTSSTSATACARSGIANRSSWPATSAGWPRPVAPRRFTFWAAGR